MKLDRALVNKMDGNVDIPLPRNSRNVPPRTGHVGVCINKYMMIWGGYTDYNYSQELYLNPDELWIYNTDIGYWFTKKTSGSFPPGTSGAAACLVDGCIYVFAGHRTTGNVNDLYCLELSTLQWEKIHAEPPYPSPRDKCASWVHNNKLYFFGGFGVPLKGYLRDNGDFHEDLSIVANEKDRGFLLMDEVHFLRRGWNNQLIVFDLETKTWSNPRCQGPVPSSRAAHAAAKIGNKIYLFGGRHIGIRMNDLHCLDLDTMRWSGLIVTEGNMPCGRSWHTFSVISDEQIFLYGGFDQDDVALNDAWILDVVNLRWTKLDHFTDCNPHLWHTACKTQEGEVLVFGGCTNNILSEEENQQHSNEVLTFRLQPQSLVKLCLEKAYQYKNRTQNEWDFLPHSLFKWLKTKDLVNNLSAKESQSNEVVMRDTGQSIGATCVVS